MCDQRQCRGTGDQLRWRRAQFETADHGNRLPMNLVHCREVIEQRKQQLVERTERQFGLVFQCGDAEHRAAGPLGDLHRSIEQAVFPIPGSPAIRNTEESNSAVPAAKAASVSSSASRPKSMPTNP
jgi:hypothetical protein